MKPYPDEAYESFKTSLEGPFYIFHAVFLPVADGTAVLAEELEGRLSEVSVSYGGSAKFIETLVLILRQEGKNLWAYHVIIPLACATGLDTAVNVSCSSYTHSSTASIST